MIELFWQWATANTLELGGTLVGLLYIWFSVQQNILTWPAGIMTSFLYVLVFYQAKFYAGMGLQGYYVAISFYGWYSWRKGSGDVSTLKVSRTSLKLWLQLLLANIVLTALLYGLLKKYTDSPIPLGDSLTSALSMTATWMLARKKIENWILWIFIDLFSCGLYLYRDLFATVILFFIYTVMAAKGYIEWRKEVALDGE